MKRILFPASIFLVFLITLNAMAQRPAETAVPAALGNTGNSAGNSSVGAGGTFRSYLTSEPANLDPARGVDVSEGYVQAKLFDGLVRYDDEMNLIGNLAETWDITDDGRVFTFHLRQGVRFHCGHEFTAHDVVFSLDRVLDPQVGSPRTWCLDRIVGAKQRLAGKTPAVEGLTAVDRYTLKITLEEPFAPFVSMLAMPACSILPANQASLAAITDHSFFEKPSGTGPYRFQERVRDSYLLLVANTAYHGGTPPLAKIELRIIPESLKAEMEFESGNLDLLQLFPSNFDRFAESREHGGRIRNVPAMNVFYVGFNNQVPPFNDVRVRRALNLLIDRQAIIDAVFKGRGIPAKSSIPPGILGHSEKTAGYVYDPVAGAALLREAGYSAKKPLRFEIFQKSSQAAFEITRLLQGELKKHGVEVSLRPMEWSALKDAINQGEATSFYLSWFGDYPDGENFLYPLFHSSNWGAGGNRARFKSDKIDHLLEAMVRIQDPQKRSEAYSRIDQMIVDEAPWLYLWHSNESYLLGSGIQSMAMSPLFSVDKGLSIHMK